MTDVEEQILKNQIEIMEGIQALRKYGNQVQLDTPINETKNMLADNGVFYEPVCRKNQYR